MASGTINGSAFGGGYLYINWSSTHNVSSNTSTVGVQVCINRYSNWATSAAKSGWVSINGVRQNFSCNVGGSGPVAIYNGSAVVAHDANGNAIINISGSLSCQITWSGSYVESINCSDNVNLGQIPRGTAITSFKTKTVDWTSISFDFAAKDVCSAIYLHVNGGGRVGTGLSNVSSGTVTATGLTPNTRYSIQLEVVRKDTGVATTSSPISISTKVGCNAVSVTSNTLSSIASIPLSISNSDGASLSVFLYLYAPDTYGGTPVTMQNVVTRSIGVVNGSYSLAFTQAEQNTIHDKLKYAVSATLEVYITSYVPNTITVSAMVKTQLCTFSYNAASVAPPTPSCTLALDATTKSILGDSTYLLQNISSITFSATKSNMSSRYGATLRSLVLQYGDATQEYDLTTSTTSFSLNIKNLAFAKNYVISYHTIDSRGLQSPAYTKTYTILSYASPIVVPNVVRELGGGGVVDISFTGRYSRLVAGGTEKNQVALMQYAFAKLGSTSFTYQNLTGYSAANAANGVDKNISYTKAGAITVDQNTNYQFRFKISDKLNTYETVVDMVDGNPIMRVLENGQIGVNCKPDTSNPNEKFRVNGNLKVIGSCEVGGISKNGRDIFDIVYPVGSVFISTSAANPSTYMSGTTWEQFAQGRTLIGVDPSVSGDTALSTGGEATHTLTDSEMPSHSHGLKDGRVFLWGGGQGDVYAGVNAVGGKSPTGTNYLYTKQNEWNSTAAAGFSAAHNNLPPYIKVYMWRRTK
ncbi:MAG: hypothetical protein PHS82_06150 [Lachnospiraceae bacterium]|nr:hypothetical protein [Lachnospiraceae bacterium]